MIVQELRQIQDRCGWLPREELLALSQRTNVPLHRIHEVASFYPGYRLSPPPTVDVRGCRDMSYHIKGADRLIESLHSYGKQRGSKDVQVGGVSCLGHRDKPIAVTINDHHVYRGLSENEIRDRMR